MLFSGGPAAPHEKRDHRYGGEPAVMFKNVFPKTASGKVELTSGYLEKRYGARLPSFRPVMNQW